MARLEGTAGGPRSDGAEVTDHSGQDRGPEHHDFAAVLGALALLLAALTALVQSVTNVATAAIALVVLGPVWLLAWRLTK